MMGMSDGCNPIGNRRRFLEIACQLTKYKAESEGYGRNIARGSARIPGLGNSEQKKLTLGHRPAVKKRKLEF
jgi:hypothetical protein